MSSLPLCNAIIKALTLEDCSKFLAFEEMATFRRNDTPPDHSPPHWTQEEFGECIARGEVMGGVFNEDEMIALNLQS